MFSIPKYVKFTLDPLNDASHFEVKWIYCPRHLQDYAKQAAAVEKDKSDRTVFKKIKFLVPSHEAVFRNIRDQIFNLQEFKDYVTQEI